jgi:uncharacterized protein (TIGR00730 family)
MKRKIVVFAANDCIKEKEKYYYSLSYETGKRLSGAGFITVTGGGPGMMNEVCRGAYENKGKTIGICLNIKGRKHSKFLTSKELFTKLLPRLEKLIGMADGYIALPGGIGTLLEIVAVLGLKRKGEIPKAKPLILIDGVYKDFNNLIKSMEKEGFVYQGFEELYKLVRSPKEAILYLQNAFS